MYTSEELRALNNYDVIRPSRAARKVIFSLRLWCPLRLRRRRRRSECQQPAPGRPFCTAAEPGLAVACVNARSVGNKAALLCRTIIEESLDVFIIVETWHERSESTTLQRVIPSGYRCIDAARPVGPDAAVNTVEFQNYGGLAFIHRDSVRFQKRAFDANVSTFEYLYGYATTQRGHFVLLAIYRPGSQAVSATFYDDLSAVFEQLATYSCPVVICGDFNVHVDQTDDPDAVRLHQLLEAFGYVQHVTEQTHTAGHTLDLVITRSETEISGIRTGSMISDHALVCFTLCTKKLRVEAEWVTRRAWRRLSREAFASDLAASGLCANLDALTNSTVDDLARLYHDVLTDLLDRHCPTVKVRRRAKQNTPWFDADCRAARRRARAAERRFRRSRSDADRRAWSEKLKAMRTLYEEKNCSHWRNEIAASNGDTRRLWRTFKDVLGDGSTAESDAHTANDFAAFFKDKVEAVRASTAATQLYDVPWRSTPTFAEWSTVTSEEVEKLIGSALNKTCQLDPAPTWLVKDMRGLLSPFISMLFNKSFSTGCFPQDFKEAVVRPLLKKSGLDASELRNYRPVSNLPLLSKLLEKVVQVRVQAFFDSNGLMPKMQSAYRRYHSPETAVTKVFNDLLLATDGGQMSAVCLLDLTAAFDTVDHELLLLRLERQFGLRGIVLDWFRSYLSGRTFRVVLSGCSSTIIYIVCSVPQGSVLGPLLFIVYTADLADVAEKHGVFLHAFADDTQLYLHCRRVDTASAADQLERCIADVGQWMSANRLKLNTEKTELLWVGSRHSLSQQGCCLPELHLGPDIIAARDHVRLLGVTLSSDLSLDKHVSTVSASSFYWLRQLRRSRRSLDTESAATLVHAFVASRIDNCNAILAGAPKATTDKLQRVLNAAARVVSGTHKFDRGLSRLIHDELHWLDVPQRVVYKLGVMVFSCLHGQAPQYLSDFCQPVSGVASRQHLRSASRRQLVVPRYKLSTYGRRAFAVAGPSVWNSLPDNLRDPAVDSDSFRRSLKTFLFATY